MLNILLQKHLKSPTNFLPKFKGKSGIRPVPTDLKCICIIPPNKTKFIVHLNQSINQSFIHSFNKNATGISSRFRHAFSE